MKKFLFFLLILSVNKIVAQNKQLLYNFAELPQSLLLNPSIDPNYNYHIGIPLLSGLSTEIGSTGFVLTDIFAEDGRNIQDKISGVLGQINSKDFAKLNIQIEVLSGGFRLNNKTYLSFGFYEEIDAIGYYPKDLITFFTEGNASYINKDFQASQLNYKVDFLGVWHIGVSKKINDKLTLGGRFKIYSSALNLESKNNTGTFITVQGTNNLYTHYFNNINVITRTSGLIDATTDEYIENTGSYFSNSFLGSNLGFGIDFGVSYKISPQLEFSASILDFGFINHKKNVKNEKINGNFSFEGVDFLFNASDSENYWDEINDRFLSDLPRTQDQESYISLRPTKINAALKYSFGERRSRICYDDNYKDFYSNAVGVQLFNVFRLLGPQLALTGFYEKSITKTLHTKFTYTIDDFSFSNIGAGFSAQIGNFNMFTMLDNILSYRNLSSTNHISLQLGFNLIFN